MNASTELLTDVREYNLCSKEYGKTLVKKYVPKEISRKIRSKSIPDKDKDRILFLLAVLILLCKDAGSDRVQVSMQELSDYLHMKHGFITNARKALVSYGLIDVRKMDGGSEHILKFDIDEESDTTSYNIRASEDGVERLFCEPAEEGKHKMTVEELLSIIEMQEKMISSFEDERNMWKEKVRELEEKLSANETSRKIEEAKEKSPTLRNAFSRFKFF